MQSVTNAAAHPVPASTTSSAGRHRFLFLLIAALAAAGAVDSGLSLQRHYARSATSFCELGGNFDCDLVNRSEYSRLMGIPVAGIGLAGYGVLFVLSWRCRRRAESPGWLLATAAIGLAFALYLTYVEAYVLGAWCLLCLISLGLIFAITGLAAVAQFHDRNRSLRSRNS